LRVRFILGPFAAAQKHAHSEPEPVGEKLDSGAVICGADTVPGMREKVVLGAVIELIPRP